MCDLPTRTWTVADHDHDEWEEGITAIVAAYGNGVLLTKAEWLNSPNIVSEPRTFVSGMCDSTLGEHLCTRAGGHDGAHMAIWYWNDE